MPSAFPHAHTRRKRGVKQPSQSRKDPWSDQCLPPSGRLERTDRDTEANSRSRADKKKNGTSKISKTVSSDVRQTIMKTVVWRTGCQKTFKIKWFLRHASSVRKGRLKKTRQTLRLLWSQRQHAQGHHREANETHPNLSGRVLTTRAELSKIAIFH